MTKIETELRELLKLKDERIKELEKLLENAKGLPDYWYPKIPQLDTFQTQTLQLLDRVYNSTCKHNISRISCKICELGVL